MFVRVCVLGRAVRVNAELQRFHLVSFSTNTMAHLETKIWKVDPSVEYEELKLNLEEAAQSLREGKTVAFPTETVYGLGANALSDEAINGIFKAKGRPSDNPLIVHVHSVEEVEKYVEEVPEIAKILASKFWPGPMTILLRKKEKTISNVALAGQPLVGIRIPQHPVALALLEQSGLPIAAPSANISGRPSPTCFEHVLEDMQGKISGIVDGGITGVGVESTVIDVTSLEEEGKVIICRPGGVTKSDLEQVLGADKVLIDPAVIVDAHEFLTKKSKGKKNQESSSLIDLEKSVMDCKPRAPGMKYVHYAPKAPLYIVDGGATLVQKCIDSSVKEGKRVGVMGSEEFLSSIPSTSRASVSHTVNMGPSFDLSAIARSLYQSLREFDHNSVDIIYCQNFTNNSQKADVTQAIMNRLLKAATSIIQDR